MVTGCRLINVSFISQDVDFQTVLGWADKFRKLRVDAHISSHTDMCAQVMLICDAMCASY